MKNMAMFILTVLIVLGLFGCSSMGKNEIDKNYLLYLQAMKQQPVILEMEAKDGEEITLGGVKKFAVYGVGKSDNIQPYQKPLSTGGMLVKEIFGTARYAIPYGFYGYAADRLFEFGKTAVKNAGHNTDYGSAVFDSYNGDQRDNPITDSYNPTDSYNDNRENYENDNRENYENDNRTDYENDYRTNYEETTEVPEVPEVTF